MTIFDSGSRYHWQQFVPDEPIQPGESCAPLSCPAPAHVIEPSISGLYHGKDKGHFKRQVEAFLGTKEGDSLAPQDVNATLYKWTLQG
jgi:hypothetical protein